MANELKAFISVKEAAHRIVARVFAPSEPEPTSKWLNNLADWICEYKGLRHHNHLVAKELIAERNRRLMLKGLRTATPALM